MCLVIDACIFLNVFEENSPKHDRFRPVFEWINFGKGKIILGGTKYKTEIIEQSRKRTKILAEFEKRNKIVKINDNKVDELANLIKEQFSKEISMMNT